MTKEITFTVRKWLNKEDFMELLKIADFIGRFRGEGSLYKINLYKAVAHGYTLEDIYRLLEYVGVELSIPDKEVLRNTYIDLTKISISWNNIEAEVRIRIPWSIYKIIKESIKILKPRYIGKDDVGICYSIKPHKLFNLKKIIEDYGYTIDDQEGLLADKKLPFNPSFRGTLRYYQREAIDKWRTNNYRGIVALPTGSGKTVVAIAAIVDIARRTLIVTFTKEQMFQWRDMIVRFTNIDPRYIGLFYSETKRLAAITITTYQSAFRNVGILGKYYDLLIIDECHHLPADKFRFIATHSIAPYRMGLSATVVREDGRHVELFPLMGGIVYHKSAAELSAEGYLARYRVYTVKVKLTKQELKEYIELKKTYKTLARGRPFKEVLEAARKGDKRAADALRIHSKMRMLVANSESKIRKAVEIARKEYENGNKVIVFTQYVEQAKRISKELGAYLLTGKLDSNTRKRILNEFKNKPSGVLVVTTVGDEGLDIPDANIGIVVSGTGSRRQFIQRLGRLLRPKPGKREAKLYEIVIEGTPDEYLSRKRRSILYDYAELEAE